MENGRDVSKAELLAELDRLRTENEQLKSRARPQSADASEIIHQNGVSAFTLPEYRRYGRQMIVPMVGIRGQVQLKAAKVLVIGAGGLGCPALLYLAGAGVGRLGIVDDDVVDESNLHRQVLHTTDKVGMYKCDSAKAYLNLLNPFVEIETFKERLTNDNVFAVFTARDWDLVLDCTDTPLTRYLINDAAVICGKTIVSGSGVKTDGQLSILNFQNTGPCYRCFYPQPPPPDSVLSCKDGGVVGPAIGVMGTMMALEAIKVICGAYTSENFKPFLNMYTGAPNQSLRLFKMRGRNQKCEACGVAPSVTRKAIESNEINYSEWCGKLDYDVVSSEERITVQEFARLLHSDRDNSVILDVRPLEQFEICHLEGSIHKPYDEVVRADTLESVFGDSEISHKTVYCICRFGNDSRLTTKYLKDKFHLADVVDVVGGLNKWSEAVDPKFPKY